MFYDFWLLFNDTSVEVMDKNALQTCVFGDCANIHAGYIRAAIIIQSYFLLMLF